MSGIIASQRSILRKSFFLRRLVSTSNKKCETATVESIKTGSEVKPAKSWVSYGYDMKDKATDRNAMHSTMFASFTLCIVVASFYWFYAPDVLLKDWAQRQAYIELHRREANGLPLVDPNFIDPAKIELPSDEELEDTEIVI